MIKNIQINVQNVNLEQKVIQIIKEHSNSSNKDLKFAMDFIKEDFELTKYSLIIPL